MVEQDITSTSRPYLRIELGPTSAAPGAPGAIPLYVISTVQAETGYYTGSTFTGDGSALITSANIEGMVPTGRKGNITVKDISGIWASRLTNVGRKSASLVTASAANIRIHWGWTGLARSRPQYSDGLNHVDEITGMIEGVKFDVLEDGVVTISIDFIQFTDVAQANIMNVKIEDIVRSDPAKLWEELENACGGEEVTAVDVINYVTAVPGWEYPKIGTVSESFAFGTLLDRKKVIIQAGSDGSIWNAKTLRGKNDLVNLEFGTSLGSWLGDMIPKVQVDESGEEIVDEGIIVSFERKNDRHADDLQPSSGFEGYVVIQYDWTAMVDPTNGDVDKEELEQNYADYLTSFGDNNVMTQGPKLFWKAGYNSENSDESEINIIDVKEYDGTQIGTAVVDNKRILNWNSDLSSQAQLFRMFKSEIDSQLDTYRDRESWDKFIENLEDYDSVEDMQAVANGSAGFFDDGFFPSLVTGWKRVGASQRRMAENFDDAYGLASTMMASDNSGEGGSRNTTLGAILAQNAFKLNVEIIGDPDIGTMFQGGTTVLKTDFTYANDEGFIRKIFDYDGNEIIVPDNERLVALFSREWILQKTEHAIGEDGSYVTKLELLGPPVLVEEGESSVESENNALRASEPQDYDSNNVYWGDSDQDN